MAKEKTEPRLVELRLARRAHVRKLDELVDAATALRSLVGRAVERVQLEEDEGGARHRLDLAMHAVLQGHGEFTRAWSNEPVVVKDIDSGPVSDLE